MADTKSKKSDKISPFQYLAQVRLEGSKVVWPSRPETITTTILVMIMVILMGIFFFVVDWFVRWGIGLVTSFGGGA